MPHLWKIKQPYNVSVAASTAAITALEDIDWLADKVSRIIDERERFSLMLAELPFLRPYPSQSNFVLCQVVGARCARFENDIGKPRDSDSLLPHTPIKRSRAVYHWKTSPDGRGDGRPEVSGLDQRRQDDANGSRASVRHAKPK